MRYQYFERLNRTNHQKRDKTDIVDLGYNRNFDNDGNVIDNIEVQYKKMQEEFKFAAPSLKIFLFNIAKQLLDIHRNKLRLPKGWMNYLMFTIKPTNPLLMIWNFLKVLLILHTFFSFPLQDTFGQLFHQQECKLFQEFILCEFIFLLLDILLNFNIESYVNGEQIKDKKLIAKSYISQEFFTDLLSLFGFSINRYFIIISKNPCSLSLQFQNGVQIILKYLFFLKLKQLNKFIIVLMQELDHQGKYKIYMKLITLLFQILMTAHIIVDYYQTYQQSCVWISISIYSSNFYQTTWLILRDIPENDWFLQYIQGMYYACMTMTTVGYGDIVPTNSIEYILCIVIMVIKFIYSKKQQLISCGFFAYTLSEITQILSELSRQKLEYKKQSDLIQSYLQQKKIDQNLQKRTINYINCMFRSGFNDQFEQQQEAIQKLSLQLQEELEFNDKGRIVMSIEFFNKHFSLNIIKQISKKIIEHHYSPQEIIRKSNNLLNENRLIYIYSGEVEVIFEKKIRNQPNAQVLFTLKKGEYFGLRELFGVNQKCLIKCKDFTIMYTLKQEDFQSVFNKDQISNEDYESYCYIRDRIMLTKNYTDLNGYCKCCLQYSHEFFDCQKLFFIPNQVFVIKKNQFSRNNSRFKFKRGRSKFKSISHLKNIQLNAENYKIQSEKYEDSEQEKSFVENSFSHCSFESNQSWQIEEINENKNDLPSEIRKFSKFNLEGGDIKISVYPRKKFSEELNSPEKREDRKRCSFGKSQRISFKTSSPDEFGDKSVVRKGKSTNSIRKGTQKHMTKFQQNSFGHSKHSLVDMLGEAMEHKFQFEMDIDIMKNYRIYYHTFNAQNVLKNYPRFIVLKQKKPKQHLTPPPILNEKKNSLFKLDNSQSLV